MIMALDLKENSHKPFFSLTATQPPKYAHHIPTLTQFILDA